MRLFSPEFSNIFKTAAFTNAVSSTSLTVLRIFLVLLFSLLIVLALVEQSFKQAYFWMALLAAALMFEIFYHEKVLETKPTKNVSEISATENIADSLTLSCAKLLLRGGAWTLVSEVLNGLIQDQKIRSFFEKAGFSKEDVRSFLKASVAEPLDLHSLLLKAKDFTLAEKRLFIDELDLLLALFAQSQVLNKAAFNTALKEPDLLNIAFWVRNLFEKSERHFWEKPPSTYGPGFSSVWEGGWTLESEKYSRNLTEEVLRGKISGHLVGRQPTILQVEEVLSRSTKRNVIVIGEAGVGKTTIVHGLAEKSAFANLPEALKYKRFFELELSALLSSAQVGVLEERLNNIITEISHAGDVVLFIPEIEFLATNESGGVDITGLILGAVQEANLQIIGTTTRAAYKKYIEPKAAFAESFEVVEIPEPGKSESIRILEEAASNIETRDKIFITYKAIEKAVDLSQRYMVDRVLPGKAIDLLDEAAAAASIQKEGILKPELVEQTVSQKTKTPVTLASGREAKTLLDLEGELHKRIIDQEEAIKAISEAVRRARALNREGTRPIGTFLFLGPTGVGKTETAKALASVYFGSEERIIREDMSELQQEAAINRLIGAPPGSEGFESGGQLTEKVRANPFSVILLDEIEKAHQKIQEAFLPVLDEGKMLDSEGRQIIFTNTIIIATSNAGAEFIRESVQKATPISEIKRALLEKLQREGNFKPEFLNRFDDTIVYKPLSPEDVKEVVKLMVKQLSDRMKKQDIEMSVDESTLLWLAQRGYDPTYGARPLRRIIQNEVEATLARKILSGEINRGSKVDVNVNQDKLVFSRIK